MTRTITASEIKPGMEIEYEHGGWTFRVVVGGCEESHGDVWVFSVAGVWRYLENGQEVTVLKEAQPDEPTAFGAKVRVRDGRFVRLDDEGVQAPVWFEKGTGYRWAWDDLFEMGPVTVVPDQGWTVPVGSEVTPEGHDATEPRTWDRWEDVPEMVAVRLARSSGDYMYRKSDGQIQLSVFGGQWESSIATPDGMRSFAPFTEVRDA